MKSDLYLLKILLKESSLLTPRNEMILVHKNPAFAEVSIKYSNCRSSRRKWNYERQKHKKKKDYEK